MGMGMGMEIKTEGLGQSHSGLFSISVFFSYPVLLPPPLLFPILSLFSLHVTSDFATQRPTFSLGSEP